MKYIDIKNSLKKNGWTEFDINRTLDMILACLYDPNKLKTYFENPKNIQLFSYITDDALNGTITQDDFYNLLRNRDSQIQVSSSHLIKNISNEQLDLFIINMIMTSSEFQGMIDEYVANILNHYDNSIDNENESYIESYIIDLHNFIGNIDIYEGSIKNVSKELINHAFSVYRNLPDELKKNFTFPIDCGPSINCVLKEFLESGHKGNLSEYTIPVPYKYVLSRPYTIKNGYVILDADIPYNKRFNIFITPPEYEDEYYR